MSFADLLDQKRPAKQLGQNLFYQREANFPCQLNELFYLGRNFDFYNAKLDAANH